MFNKIQSTNPEVWPPVIGLWHLNLLQAAPARVDDSFYDGVDDSVADADGNDVDIGNDMNVGVGPSCDWTNPVVVVVLTDVTWEQATKTHYDIFQHKN